MKKRTDVLAYLHFKTLMRCIEGKMMGVCTERRGWAEPGREGACVPFIAQLSRKSLLMERHLQGISPPLQRVGRNVEKVCVSENRGGGAKWHRGERRKKH